MQMKILNPSLKEVGKGRRAKVRVTNFHLRLLSILTRYSFKYFPGLNDNINNNNSKNIIDKADDSGIVTTPPLSTKSEGESE